MAWNGQCWVHPTEEQREEKLRELKRRQRVPEDTPGFDWMNIVSQCEWLSFNVPNSADV